MRTEWPCRALMMVLLLTILGDVHGHEVRPALLQITRTGEGEYEVLWKVPRIGDRVIGLRPQFPEWFNLQQKGPGVESGGGAIFTYAATAIRDVHGMRIEVKDLELTMVEVLVKVDLGGESHALVMRPREASVTIPMRPSAWSTIRGYVSLGMEHILTGYDHLLFVLALLLIVGGLRPLLVTITSFTVAHSLTLSLSALGHLSLPGPPVEATIALSILFLAREIIAVKNGRDSLTQRKPWLVAFTFGLLHGLGFAGALAEVGLPQGQVPLALACFNVGVELGQLLFILVAMAVMRLLTMKKDWPVILQKLPAYGIGSLAAFWFIERVLAFWDPF